MTETWFIRWNYCNSICICKRLLHFKTWFYTVHHKIVTCQRNDKCYSPELSGISHLPDGVLPDLFCHASRLSGHHGASTILLTIYSRAGYLTILSHLSCHGTRRLQCHFFIFFCNLGAFFSDFDPLHGLRCMWQLLIRLLHDRFSLSDSVSGGECVSKAGVSSTLRKNLLVGSCMFLK